MLQVTLDPDALCDHMLSLGGEEGTLSREDFIDAINELLPLDSLSKQVQHHSLLHCTAAPIILLVSVQLF